MIPRGGTGGEDIHSWFVNVWVIKRASADANESWHGARFSEQLCTTCFTKPTRRFIATIALACIVFNFSFNINSLFREKHCSRIS